MPGIRRQKFVYGPGTAAWGSAASSCERSARLPARRPEAERGAIRAFAVAEQQVVRIPLDQLPVREPERTGAGAPADFSGPRLACRHTQSRS